MILYPMFNIRRAFNVSGFIILLLGAAPLLGEVIPSNNDSEKKVTQGSSERLVVELQQSQDIRALLVPQVETQLSAQLSGQIGEVSATIGSRFKRGDMLLRFNCGLYKASLEQARAEHQAAKQATQVTQQGLITAQKTHDANRRLIKHKAVSKLDLSLSETEVSKARAQISQSKAEVKQAISQISLAKVRVGLCNVKAPFSGRVSKLHIKSYQTVSDGQPLIDILDDSQLKMELFIPSMWLAWLKTGAEFEVAIDETQKTYSAKVTAIGAKVDPVSQTIAITAKIKEHHQELLAGMSGSAKFAKSVNTSKAE